MGLPDGTDPNCDECTPAYLKRSLASLVISSFPFIATFAVVAVLAARKLYPLLCGETSAQSFSLSSLTTSSPKSTPQIDRDGWELLPAPVSARTSGNSTGSGAASGLKGRLQSLLSSLNSRRLACYTFATNIGLAAVLVELILCEISDTLNPVARSWSIRVTLTSLLILLILVTPALELHTVISAAGLRFKPATEEWRRGLRGVRTAWLLEVLGVGGWLVAFFWFGRSLLGTWLHEESYVRKHTMAEGCLERIGVIGVTLMASLAGFAAVSSLWQTFGVKKRTVSLSSATTYTIPSKRRARLTDTQVTDTDISRKQTGLDSTLSMLSSKRSRLRALERKVSTSPSGPLFSRLLTSVRGNPDLTEIQTLRIEISGLETMASTLSTSITQLRSRLAAQQRSGTLLGRMLKVFNVVFSVYCAWRIAATCITTARRLSAPATTFAASDPVTNILALLAKHWDPSLDRRAWSRIFSFLLSGGMLLASFSAVWQTVLVFARLAPSILRNLQANLPLAISQVAATYVISAALLLRSNLPDEVRGVVSRALGAPLEPKFVERWFEGWFLAASLVTAMAVVVSRSVNADWDETGDEGEGSLEKLS